MNARQATRELFAALGDYPHIEPDKEAAERSLRRMRAALKAGANWKAKLGPGQRDAAFTAAVHYDEKPLELLFKHGVPADHTGEDGTLLHRAASFGRVKIIRALLKRGLQVDALDPFGKTPLDHARGWKHGTPAVPLLTKLTAAARKKRGASQADRSADLARDSMIAAVRALASDKKVGPSVARTLERHAKAAFVGKSAIRSENFLLELAERDEPALLAAGMRAVAAATRKKASRRKEKGGELTVAHVGDLTVGGDCDACVLVVTGNLTVKGRLTNWEGRIVCVGGDVRADTVVTEGPLWVGGDLQVKKAIFATYNDYRATVRGTLSAPVLIKDNHVVEARKLEVEEKYGSISRIPAARRPKLEKLLRVRL